MCSPYLNVNQLQTRAWELAIVSARATGLVDLNIGARKEPSFPKNASLGHTLNSRIQCIQHLFLMHARIPRERLFCPGTPPCRETCSQAGCSNKEARRIPQPNAVHMDIMVHSMWKRECISFLSLKLLLSQAWDALRILWFWLDVNSPLSTWVSTSNISYHHASPCVIEISSLSIGTEYKVIQYSTFWKLFNDLLYTFDSTTFCLTMSSGLSQIQNFKIKNFLAPSLLKVFLHPQNLHLILSNLSNKWFPLSYLCLCVCLKREGNDCNEQQYWQDAEPFV